MWARIVECMIAFWLSLSPFIFAYRKEEHFFWLSDYIFSFLLLLFSLLSFHKSLRKMHLLNFFVAFWLIGVGYISEDSLMPALQNYLVIGLVLLFLTFVPSESELPPKSWQEFFK